MEQAYLTDKKFEGQAALWPFLKRIFSYSFRYKASSYAFIIAVVAVGLSDAIWPVIWMYFLDGVVVPMVKEYQQLAAQGTPYTLNFKGLWEYFFYFLGNGIFQVIGVLVFVWFGGKIQEYVLFDLRAEMFRKLQKLSYSFYDKSALGWLLSRLTSDADKVAELISWGFLECVWGITMIILTLVIMFFYSWKLALVVTLSLPLLFFLSIKIRKLILVYSRASRKINSEITATFTEQINGVEVNKITAQEQRVSNDFKVLSNNMQQKTFRATFYTAMYMPIVIFVGAVTAIFVINIGGNMAITFPAGITVGILAAFFGFATRIFEPILDITRFYANAQNCISAGERIFGLIDEQADIKDTENAIDVETIKGAIEFKNVYFEYTEGKPILTNFNLSIEPGTSVALVGATGDGKTTITNLIGRFYEPKSGSIFIDGIDYKNIKLNSLRKRMGVVLQTPHLFKGTVLENIIYAKQNATNDEVIFTLKKLGAAQFINRLKEEVGENGDNLSLGEKQLISFARATLANPSILIMDEATSSIDTQTEQKIQLGIQQLISNRTSIIVAHRLSTIKNCDRILVIKKGEIIEDGDHKTLIEKEGVYFNLYTKQFI